ncbi:MAG: sterol desaturase family protein [Burkholderiales bacterium]
MSVEFSSMLDAALKTWPGAVLHDLLKYALAAAAMALALRLAPRSWIAPRRLQARASRAGDIVREMLYSASTVLIFSINATAIVIGADYGLFRVYRDIAEFGWPYFLASLAILIIAHDAYFYWTHRLMHSKRLFRLFHRAHHLSRTPTPWAAYAFAPAEAVVQAAFLPLALLILPAHWFMLFLFTLHMIVRNVLGHSGVAVEHARMQQGVWSRWMTTTAHHDLHHERGQYNYGLYFAWWDRFMGTEHPEYRARLREIIARRAS